MATHATSLKIPEHLKARVEAAADAVGKSPHAFMLEAIEDGTARVESRREFVDRALRAREDFSNQRAGYAADEVHRYMTQRAQGKKPKKPSVKRWPK
jgi:predicted transcriptional regulator